MNASDGCLVRNPPRVALAFRLLESTVCIRTDDPVAADQIRSCFDPSSQFRNRCSAPFDLSVDLRIASTHTFDGPAPLRVATNPPGALDVEDHPFEAASPLEVARLLVQWAVQSAAKHYIFHAGAVALEDRAVLLPAPSFSGKSTLTVALAQRGFGILSDEVGAVEMANGRLVGFPRSLSLRPGVLPVLGLPYSVGSCFEKNGSRIVRAQELGLHRKLGARLRLIVVPQFARDSVTELEPLRPGQTVMALMKTSCSQSRFKVTGFDFVMELARRLPCFRLRYSDAHEAAAVVEEAFANHAPDSALPCERAPSPERSTRTSMRRDELRPRTRDDLVFRQEGDDFFVYDPVCDRVALLNMSAALIFDLCDGSRTPQEIGAEVAVAFRTSRDLVDRDVGETLKGFARSGFLGTAVRERGSQQDDPQ